MIRRLAAAAAMAFIWSASPAATISWTGFSLSENWSDSTGWDLGRVPMDGDDVVIDAGGIVPSNYDLVGVTLKSIFIGSSDGQPLVGNQISIESGGSIVIDDSLPIPIHTPIRTNGPMLLRVREGSLHGEISGTGPLNIETCFNLELHSANTYSGPTQVSTFGPGCGLPFGIDVFSPAGIPPTSALTVNANVKADFKNPATVPSIAGAGSVEVVPGVVLTVGDSSSTLFSGRITGSLLKVGSGTLTLSGPVFNMGGTTTVSAGRLDMTGIVQSAVTVAGGILGGTATIAESVIVNAGGTLAPGLSTGILNTGNLALAAGSTFAMELNGTTPGTQHDQVNVTGSVDLGGATLAATLGYVPVVGDTLTIIQNDNADAVAGTFAGLAQGAVLMLGGNAFVISYTGGDGNDVTLTAASVPGAPAIGAATPGNGQAMIAFTAPASNGGSPITGYTMTCGAFSANGAPPSITVTGLSNGTTYNCSVVAINAIGTSAPSGTVSVTPRDVPGAPTIGTATPGNGQATIAFTAPASTGGSPITGYMVTCNPGAIAGNGAGSPIIVTGLANGTPYDCSVTAINAAGTSIPSATVPVTPRTVPDAPVIGAATPGNAQATIAFTPPAFNGGSVITGYTANCTPSGTASGTASPLTVTGLANGTTYTCSVTATNAAGTSATSGTVTVTPSFNVFSGPSATGTGTITASFTGGGAACAFSTPAFIGAPPGSPPVPPVAPGGGITFPHGLFDFRAVGCAAGGTLSFTVVYPTALPAGAVYFKYGPTPDDSTPHWYILPAVISGNAATFTITDGGLGDDDLLADGTIVDQGGPGVFPPGSGVQQTPTLSEWAMILMTMLIAMTGIASMRRRTRR